MCKRPWLRAEFEVEADESGRPVLCGRLVGWADTPEDQLPLTGLRVETIDLDGIHLTDLNQLVWDWMHKQNFYLG